MKNSTSMVTGLALSLVLGTGVAATAFSYHRASSAPPATSTPGMTQAAYSLQPFDDCDALRDWYVEHSIDEVGPYGWDEPMYAMMRDAPPGAIPQPMGTDSDAAGEQSSGRSASATGTNTQEADVDEPDLAKTDGTLVVRLQRGRELVLTDVTGPEPRDVGRYVLPRNSYGAEVLLVGTHVLVVLESPTVMYDGPVPHLSESSSRIAPGFRASGTTILDVDISDPSTPQLARTDTYSGRALSLRQYDDRVRIVLSDGPAALPFVTPGGRGQFSSEQAEARNRDVVRDSTIEDWLPTRSTDAGEAEPVVECGDVLHPDHASGTDTVSVVGYDVDRPEESESTAITAAGEQVYSSSDHLYLTSAEWSASRGLPNFFLRRGRPKVSTQIHQFTLAGTGARYVASGEVDGTVRDSWSMDERDGLLRVAVSWPEGHGGQGHNGVVVLGPRDGALQEVGRLADLGIDEQIQSVRWLDDLAIVVTFRQVDPLYTIDLSDPARPRQLGALKVPGFSAYLHPLGQDQLLGLGTDADQQGRDLGAQAAVYDLSNLADVRQLGKVVFGEDTSLRASDDPRAFTWLPEQRVALSVMNSYAARSATSMVLLRVGPDGSLSTEERPAPRGGYERALPLPGDRVALVGDGVEVVSVR